MTPSSPKPRRRRRRKKEKTGVVAGCGPDTVLGARELDSFAVVKEERDGLLLVSRPACLPAYCGVPPRFDKIDPMSACRRHPSSSSLVIITTTTTTVVVLPISSLRAWQADKKDIMMLGEGCCLLKATRYPHPRPSPTSPKQSHTPSPHP